MAAALGLAQRDVRRARRAALVRRPGRVAVRPPGAAAPRQQARSRPRAERAARRRRGVVRAARRLRPARVAGSASSGGSTRASGTRPASRSRYAALPLLARETAAVLAGDVGLARALPRGRPRQHAVGRHRGRGRPSRASSSATARTARRSRRSRTICAPRRGAASLLAVASKNDPRGSTRAVRATTRACGSDSTTSPRSSPTGGASRSRSPRSPRRSGSALDSLVFADDNPAECAEVAAALPDVDDHRARRAAVGVRAHARGEPPLRAVRADGRGRSREELLRARAAAESLRTSSGVARGLLALARDARAGARRRRRVARARGAAHAEDEPVQPHARPPHASRTSSGSPPTRRSICRTLELEDRFAQPRDRRARDRRSARRTTPATADDRHAAAQLPRDRPHRRGAPPRARLASRARAGASRGCAASTSPGPRNAPRRRPLPAARLHAGPRPRRGWDYDLAANGPLAERLHRRRCHERDEVASTSVFDEVLEDVLGWDVDIGDDDGPGNGRGLGLARADPARPRARDALRRPPARRRAARRTDGRLARSSWCVSGLPAPRARHPRARFAFSQEDLFAFAEASGDRNPLHLDRQFARRTPFGGRIVHGSLLTLGALGDASGRGARERACARGLVRRSRAGRRDGQRGTAVQREGERLGGAPVGARPARLRASSPGREPRRDLASPRSASLSRRPMRTSRSRSSRPRGRPKATWSAVRTPRHRRSPSWRGACRSRGARRRARGGARLASYVVGMELPGLHGVFAAGKLSIADGAADAQRRQLFARRSRPRHPNRAACSSTALSTCRAARPSSRSSSASHARSFLRSMRTPCCRRHRLLRRDGRWS